MGIRVSGILLKFTYFQEMPDMRPFKPRGELVREDLVVFSAQQYDYALPVVAPNAQAKANLFS